MFQKELLDSMALSLYVIVVVAFPVSLILLAKILGPSNPNPTKNSTFECGQKSTGEAHIGLSVQYFPYVLVYATIAVFSVLMFLTAPELLKQGPGKFVFLTALVIITVGLLSAASSFETRGGKT